MSPPGELWPRDADVETLETHIDCFISDSDHPRGGGEGEGGDWDDEAGEGPGDAAEHDPEESAGEREHAEWDGGAAGQDQQDVGHAGQVEGRTSLCVARNSGVWKKMNNAWSLYLSSSLLYFYNELSRQK